MRGSSVGRIVFPSTYGRPVAVCDVVVPSRDHRDVVVPLYGGSVPEDGRVFIRPWSDEPPYLGPYLPVPNIRSLESSI